MSLNIDGRPVSEPQLVANPFKDYFISIGATLVEGFQGDTSTFKH